MVQKALVVEKDGKLMAKVVRPEACATCRACDFGQKQELLVPIEGEYAPGEEIELEVADGSVSKMALLAYGVPLACFLLGFILGGLVAGALGVNEDIARGAGAVILAAAGYLFAVRPLGRRIKAAGGCDMCARHIK